MLHVLTHLHPIKRQGLLSTAKMSELVSRLDRATTTRRRSARLSVGGGPTLKPTPCLRKRKRLDDDELPSIEVQGHRDFQIPDPPTVDLSPKEQRRSRKRKTNKSEGSRKSVDKSEPELQPNPSPVYIIPDVEKKEINFHGRLGVSES